MLARAIHRSGPQLKLFCVLSLALMLLSCWPEGRTRPYGDVHLGKIADLAVPETRLPLHNLIVRFDSAGFSAMSTMCTYDLTPLKFELRDGREILVSEYSTSTYDLQGHVLTGPAKLPLPYYQLTFASSVYGGPVDSLYAKIGYEVPEGWRLAK